MTNACFDTCSYLEFATDYYLYRNGMIWFWDEYTKNEAERAQITAFPFRARPEQLAGLPAAPLINGESDVLRGEEAYVSKPLPDGVECDLGQSGAIIQDFVMLNAPDQTNACRTAMDLAMGWLKRK